MKTLDLIFVLTSLFIFGCSSSMDRNIDEDVVEIRAIQGDMNNSLNCFAFFLSKVEEAGYYISEVHDEDSTKGAQKMVSFLIMKSSSSKMPGFVSDFEYSKRYKFKKYDSLLTETEKQTAPYRGEVIVDFWKFKNNVDSLDFSEYDSLINHTRVPYSNGILNKNEIWIVRDVSGKLSSQYIEASKIMKAIPCINGVD